jgi:hypothetical protein
MTRRRVNHGVILQLLLLITTVAFDFRSKRAFRLGNLRKLPIDFLSDVDAPDSVGDSTDVDAPDSVGEITCTGIAFYATSVSADESTRASENDAGYYFSTPVDADRNTMQANDFFYGNDTIPRMNSTASLTSENMAASRREWLQGLSIALGAALVTRGTMPQSINDAATSTIMPQQPATLNIRPLTPSANPPATKITPKQPTASTRPLTPSANQTATKSSIPPPAAGTGKFEAVNLTLIAAETAINVTLDFDKEIVSLDSKNFTKIKTVKVPSWLPSFLSPQPQIIQTIPNSEVMEAAIVAGTITEMCRTSLLYPLQTVKTRIQADIHNRTLKPPPLEKRVEKLVFNVRRHVNEGGLYAGIYPSLLVSAPATGVYYGVRDVTKRILLSMTGIDHVTISLTAALVADVISLIIRTPGDALALRLQIQDNEGDWFGDSLKRLPAAIVTDLPYLLSKIFLSQQFIHGSISIDQYVEVAIFSAVVAAFLTTPFDVARTRILIDSDGDFNNGIDGGSGDPVFLAMRKIAREGDGGIENLFAGWFERVLYLGIGRAWLEPIQLIGYAGIRDALLLKWL